MAKNETKLTLVQIRYMEKRINATRDAAEKRIMHEYEAARGKIKEVPSRSSEEIAAKIVAEHPTLPKTILAAWLARENRYNGARDTIISVFGVSNAWYDNADAHKAQKAEFDALTSRQRKAIGAIVDVATEATDAIYLGDASQLNTILSKMDKVKF